MTWLLAAFSRAVQRHMIGQGRDERSAFGSCNCLCSSYWIDIVVHLCSLVCAMILLQRNGSTTESTASATPCTSYPSVAAHRWIRRFCDMPSHAQRD